MNKTRILGIMNNLLLEMQEAGLLTNYGVSQISKCISNYVIDTQNGD